MKIKNFTVNNCIIDREDDIEQITTILTNAEKTQVHIVFAETGFGKSSFTTKLSQEKIFANWDVIRIIHNPQNVDSNVPEWSFFNLIFDALMNYFKKSDRSYLNFENYITNGNNKLLERIFLNESIDDLSSASNRKNLFSRLLKLSSKRALKIGTFNPYVIINDDSPINQSIKSDYIRFLFENTRILLIIENIQNIDDVSYKYLLDWINETKNKKHGFIFEFTISNSHKIQEMYLLQQSLSKTAVEVYECKLEKMNKEYIPDIVDCQIADHPSDIHFTIQVQKHYENYSDGNLRELIDFARVYDESQPQNNITTPTLSILVKLSSEAQYVVSILACHSGKMRKSLFEYIWLNYFSNKSKNFLNEIYDELKKNYIVSTYESDNTEQITVSHASILDAWHSKDSNIIAIDKDVHMRLKNFYNDNYNGKTNMVNKQIAWQMLIRIYSVDEPSKIMELLNDFKANIIKVISREDTWKCLNLLINATKDRICTLKDVYFQILRICCSASLYNEGYSCIQLMEKQINIETEPNLLLNKVLFLSILDKHNEAIDLYNRATDVNNIDNSTLINLKLLILNSYIALGNQKACLKIDYELVHIYKIKKQPEYAIYLRLTNIYVSPSRALKDAKKSVKLFHKQENFIQEGKSLITYSKLLSSLGKHKKAITNIKLAEKLLAESNEGFSCIYNNLAGYLLLSGEHGSEVWNYLDIAELYSVSTYDKLSVVQNKLAWCYENNSFVRLDLLESMTLELVELEPSQFTCCTALYNLYIAMEKAGYKDKANKYYLRAMSLKDKCSYVKARVDGIKWKTRYIKPRIIKPYHICYLSFWVFDL